MHLKFGNRHWNFYIAVAVGVVVAAATLIFAPDMFPAVGASAFSLTYLVLTGRDMPHLTADYLRKHADSEDAPPLIVFLLTIGVVAYVTVALFMALNSKSELGPLHLGLGIASVILCWLMIHVMWGMHYAWEFYEAPDRDDADTAKHPQVGGLKFPDTAEPCGMDFVYFSMVIAMTAQTSDVDIERSAMRRIVTAQSLFSYLFNTVMIAAAVNIVVTGGS